jgi:polyadenylate-binding protein
MMLANKKVFVGSFVPRKERMQQNMNRKFTNVYVKNLPESVDDVALKNIFAAYGTIKSAVIMKDADAEKSRGFGFVNFETPEQAQIAVDALNEKTHDGKTLFVGRAQKKSVREAELKARFEQMKLEQMTKWQGVNLYIKNLDDNFEDSKLRKVFEPFGTITSAKVMMDLAKGVSRGFGFVCFTTPEEATKAVTEMNGKMVDSKPLYVALAQRKEIRRVQLEAQFAQRKQMASRLPAPIYNGAPMFYAQATGQPGFVTIPQMVAPPPRSRFPGAPYQMPPNYVMMGGANNGGGGGRGQGIKGGRPGGPGGNAPGQGGPQGGRSRGMKQGGAPVGTPGAAPTALPGQAATGVSAAPPTTTVAIDPTSGAMVSVPQILAALNVEDQKRAMGDLLYPMIEKITPAAAAKITGMILESVPIEEMMHLAENPAALGAKVEEGLKVLREHADKQLAEAQQ